MRRTCEPPGPHSGNGCTGLVYIPGTDTLKARKAIKTQKDMGLEKQIEECGGGEKEDVIKKKIANGGKGRRAARNIFNST